MVIPRKSVVLIRIKVFLVHISAVLMALGVGAILIVIAGATPVQAYQSLVIGAFGSVNAIAEVLVKTAPLILASLGVTTAYKCNFINLGAEGQLTIGALFALIFGLNFGGLNPGLFFPLVAIVSFTAGMFWIAIPALLRSKLRVNEIVTTLMMNYVAFWIINFLVSVPLKDPASALLKTPILPMSARFPKILPGTRLHLGFIISVLFVPIVYLLLSRTSLSYNIKAVGLRERAALYGGINVPKTLLVTALISGGLAGLGGMNETIGINYFMTQNFSPGYGWHAIIIALLGGLRTANTAIVAFLFAAMIIGAENMQRTAGVPAPLIIVIQALLVFFVLGSKILIERAES